MTDDHEELSDRDRTSFMVGEVAAIEAVLFAMVASHPDRDRLLSELQKAEVAGVATANATSPSDQYIAGMRHIFDRMIEVCCRLQ